MQSIQVRLTILTVLFFAVLVSCRVVAVASEEPLEIPFFLTESSSPSVGQNAEASEVNPTTFVLASDDLTSTESTGDDSVSPSAVSAGAEDAVAPTDVSTEQGDNGTPTSYTFQNTEASTPTDKSATTSSNDQPTTSADQTEGDNEAQQTEHDISGPSTDETNKADQALSSGEPGTSDDIQNVDDSAVTSKSSVVEIDPVNEVTEASVNYQQFPGSVELEASDENQVENDSAAPLVVSEPLIDTEQAAELTPASVDQLATSPSENSVEEEAQAQPADDMETLVTDSTTQESASVEEHEVAGDLAEKSGGDSGEKPAAEAPEDGRTDETPTVASMNEQVDPFAGTTSQENTSAQEQDPEAVNNAQAVEAPSVEPTEDNAADVPADEKADGTTDGTTYTTTEEADGESPHSTAEKSTGESTEPAADELTEDSAGESAPTLTETVSEVLTPAPEYTPVESLLASVEDALVLSDATQTPSTADVIETESANSTSETPTPTPTISLALATNATTNATVDVNHSPSYSMSFTPVLPTPEPTTPSPTPTTTTLIATSVSPTPDPAAFSSAQPQVNSSTPAPIANATITPAPTPVVTPTPAPTATMTVTPAPTNSTSAPTVAPTMTPAPAPTNSTSAPTLTPTVTPTSAPALIELASSPTPTPTAAPTPTPTPAAPSPSPTMTLASTTTALSGELCAAGEETVSVRGKLHDFCVPVGGLKCSGSSSTGGICPGAQKDLELGSKCVLVAQGVYGCVPTSETGAAPTSAPTTTTSTVSPTPVVTPANLGQTGSASS